MMMGREAAYSKDTWLELGCRGFRAGRNWIRGLEHGVDKRSRKDQGG